LSDRKIGSINAIRPILRSLNPGALTQLKSEVFTGVRYSQMAKVQLKTPSLFK
jgi:hypothetical protein